MDDATTSLRERGLRSRRYSAIRLRELRPFASPVPRNCSALPAGPPNASPRPESLPSITERRDCSLRIVSAPDFGMRGSGRDPCRPRRSGRSRPITSRSSFHPGPRGGHTTWSSGPFSSAVLNKPTALVTMVQPANAGGHADQDVQRIVVRREGLRHVAVVGRADDRGRDEPVELDPADRPGRTSSAW